MEAKFWKDEERDIAIERLRANQMGIVSRKWRWDHVLEAFIDPKSYCWFFLVMAISYLICTIWMIALSNNNQNSIRRYRHVWATDCAIIWLWQLQDHFIQHPFRSRKCYCYPSWRVASNSNQKQGNCNCYPSSALHCRSIYSPRPSPWTR